MDKYEPTFVVTDINKVQSLSNRELHVYRYAGIKMANRILKMNLYDVFEILKQEVKKVNDAHPQCIPIKVTVVNDEAFSRWTMLVRSKSTKPLFTVSIMDIGAFPVMTKQDIEEERP